MKQLLSLLLKIGIPALIVYAAVATNPEPNQHKTEIAAKRAAMAEKDVLGQADRLMFGDLPDDASAGSYTYQNYFVCSKVTGPKGRMASFGLFNRVFVTQNEF